MSGPRVRPYPERGTIAIANGEEFNINISGTFVRVRTADQTFKLVFDDVDYLVAEQDDLFRFDQGAGFRGVRIVNDSGNTLNVQLEIGSGDIRSNRTSITAAVKVKNDDAPNNVLTTENTKASTITTTEAVTVADGAAAAVLVAANANRRTLILENLDVIGSIWVGDSNVAVGRGKSLSGGETLILGQECGGFSGALYAVNSSGYDMDIAITEIED
tara:strand:+ start:654 stop:1301 length:648 start_codon:yes stop_codon:yes gene_type:complete